MAESASGVSVQPCATMPRESPRNLAKQKTSPTMESKIAPLSLAGSMSANLERSRTLKQRNTEAIENITRATVLQGLTIRALNSKVME